MPSVVDFLQPFEVVCLPPVEVEGLPQFVVVGLPPFVVEGSPPFEVQGLVLPPNDVALSLVLQQLVLPAWPGESQPRAWRRAGDCAGISGAGTACGPGWGPSWHSDHLPLSFSALVQVALLSWHWI